MTDIVSDFSRQSSDKRGWLFPYLLLTIGMIYSLSFLAQIWSGSVLSVDSGLKYLMVRQYSEGDFSLAIHSSKPEWVQDLWNQGFFPIRPPFVYPRGNEQIVVFPPLFQILSTPLFMAFGKIGLLLIPMMALWVLWYRFIALCRGLGVRPLLISLFVGILIFASPLTAYGVEFWEHTLGALLVFVCFEYAIFPEIGKESRLRVMFYGALAGLSVWIRPESFILLIPLLLYIVYFHRCRRALFLGGALILVLAYFSFNLMVSGWPFGFHGRQVLEVHGVGSYSAYYLTRFLPMLARLLKTFPLILVFIPVILISHFVLKRRDLLLLSLLLLVFFLVSPLFFPNSGGGQWGPRYFLSALVPVTTVIVVVLDALNRQSYLVTKNVLAGLTALVFLIGSLINYFGIRDYLYTVHHLRADALARYLEKSKITEVVTNRTYIPLEVAELFGKKNFFFSADLLDGAGPALEEFTRHGISSFFLLSPKEPINLPSHIRLKDGTLMQFSYQPIPIVSLYQVFSVSCYSEGR